MLALPSLSCNSLSFDDVALHQPAHSCCNRQVVTGDTNVLLTSCRDSEVSYCTHNNAENINGGSNPHRSNRVITCLGLICCHICQP